MEKSEIQAMLDKQTEKIFTRMDITDATLKPIAEIYDQAQGFNKVLRFIFKSIIVPLSVIIGILLTIREIFSTHLPK